MIITLKTGGNPADAYGRLKAVQAEIALEEKRLKQRLLDLAGDKDAVEGVVFRVSISRIAASDYLDPKKVKALVTDALWAQMQSMKKPSIRFMAKARVASAQMEADDAAA